jgi:hypothetical protein
MKFVDSGLTKNILRQFGAYGVEIGLVSPTDTAMDKSIMDATAPFRDFLKSKGIHDFSGQGQGAENKRVLEAEYVQLDRLAPTKVSLYRPPTKAGDPRVWFYSLRSYASPHDILALIQREQKLYIVNVSDAALLASMADPASPLGQIVASINQAISPVAATLLDKLRAISAQGFIQTMRAGHTGVGFTLETLLGIAANSSKAPDYFGIEVKASRHAPSRIRAKTRMNLFSQVPEWKHVKSRKAHAAMVEYGYKTDGRRQLYCTVDAGKANTQGLVLRMDAAASELTVAHSGGGKETCVFVWQMTKLRARLQEKHRESFWVKAEVRQINGVEHFRYHEVLHTDKPLLANLALAIADSIVTLDLTMSEKSAVAVRDHGYLFKIWPEDLPVLFPSVKKYPLG